jgi:hypothetical protein
LAADAAFPPLHIRSFQQFGSDIAVEVYLRAASL